MALDNYTDAELGLAPPQLEPDYQPQEFQTTPWQRVLEGLSGVQPQQPRGFGESFLSGLTGQLGAQGQRIGTARQRFDARQEERRRSTDERRRKSSEEYRQERASRLKEVSKSQSDERRRVADYERDNPQLTPDMLAAAPWLSRVASPDGRVPRSALITAAKPEPQPRETGVVAIDTPNGPRYVRPSQAVGQPPQSKPQGAEKLKPPTASERGDLIYDIGLLKQLGDVRTGLSDQFVGPGKGLVGKGLQMAGGMSKKESGFRASLSSIRNQILKMRSGGAVTPGEAQRLLDELPTIDDPPRAFRSKLDQFEDTARFVANSRRETMSSTGVDLSKLPPLPGSRPPLSSFGSPDRPSRTQTAMAP